MKRVPLDASNDLGRLLTGAFQPEHMPRHERKFQFFRFQEPALGGKKTKALTRLCTSDLMMGAIQVIADGGDARLHLHAAADGMWMVLKGRASFRDENNMEHEFGPMEGALIPRGTPYAFRKVGDETLVLLQVECLHAAAKTNFYKVLDPPSDVPRLPLAERTDLYDARLE